MVLLCVVVHQEIKGTFWFHIFSSHYTGVWFLNIPTPTWKSSKSPLWSHSSAVFVDEPFLVKVMLDNISVMYTRKCHIRVLIVIKYIAATAHCTNMSKCYIHLFITMMFSSVTWRIWVINYRVTGHTLETYWPLTTHRIAILLYTVNRHSLAIRHIVTKL